MPRKKKTENVESIVKEPDKKQTTDKNTKVAKKVLKDTVVEEKSSKIKETKVKAAKNKAVKKEVNPNTSFEISDIISWTDEECLKRDKDLKFTVADVRNILKSLVSVSDQLNGALSKLNLLKATLAKGLMTGYRVICPHCKRNYTVGSDTLVRGKNIMCKICGNEYREDENIDGITIASSEEKVEII